MNYQNIIDQLLPNQFSVSTNWLDPETNEIVAIALFPKGKWAIENLAQFVIYQIDLSEISIRRTGIVFEFGEFVDGELIPLAEIEYETLREAFIELIRFIIDRQLDSFFDDPNI